VVSLLLGLSPLAADPVIHRGIDVFTTTANGKTYYDFAENPIPAGFFCKSSRAFRGRVALRGLPLETAVPGQLRGADTVIERLDDAVFNANGVAETRIRFRALSLVSVSPIKTSCGAYHVYATLAGEQRATTMRIERTQERGGTFVAPLDIAVRLSFVPVRGRKARKLELTTDVTLPAQPMPWSFTAGTGAKKIGPVLIDTDGNLTPDARLSGTSNFAPGWSPDGVTTPKACRVCEPEMCHAEDGEQHCTGPIYACSPANCP
jgi:hypothetical protein